MKNRCNDGGLRSNCSIRKLCEEAGGCLKMFCKFAAKKLLLTIQWYLAQSPCKEAAAVLRNEIERFHLLPPRYDVNGRPHAQSLDRYERSIPIGQPSIVSLIERLNSLICRSVPPVISRLPLRIFSSKRQSLCRTEEPKKNLVLLDKIVASKSYVNCNAARTFQSRQLGRRFQYHQMLPKESVQSLDLHCRLSGHLSSIFCVAFDRTGHFIFTGADDRLVKVWSATSGLLRFTLRGHSAQITDISVSDDNSFLASGSLDKSVRVWNLRSAASLALLRNHTSAVTLLTFLPYVCGQTRYLLSTGGDCVANFYKYASDDVRFSNYERISFNERVSPGSRLVSSCCSPGGSLVVIGDTHRFLRLFKLCEDGVFKLKDIEAHTDRVDSLAWAHFGLRFVSGSKDGIAKVWRFRYDDWESVVLDTKKRDEKTSVNSRRAYKVTMVCWTLEDDYVVTSGSDHALVVWNPNTGALLKQLEGHKEDTYVLIAHPLYREYVLSAGHDGLFMVWDIVEGTLVKRYQNLHEVNGCIPLFDFSISPDGTLVAAVDSLGRLSIFGMGASQKVKTTPKEQFFITDYMPVAYDQSGELVDEDTAIAPHLMPPPLLVDGDGTEYSMEIQRLVPGRDILHEDVMNEGHLCPSPWLSRDLILHLPASIVSNMNSRLNALRELETKEYSRESCRKKPANAVNLEQLSRQPVSSSRRRNEARSSVRYHQSHTQEAAVHVEEEIVFDEAITSNSSEDSTFDSASSSDDEESELSDDTSDTDYSVTEHAVSRRRRVRDRNGSDNSEVLNTSKRRSVRKRKKAYDSGSDEEENEMISSVNNEPGTSRSQRRTRQRVNGTVIKRSVSISSNEAAGTTASNSSADFESVVPGLPHKSSEAGPSEKSLSSSVVNFPSWMRLVRPVRFPYIAQIGDVVVYFRQGHDLYLKTVEEYGLYRVSPRMRPLAQLDAEEMCLVTEVKYVRRPYRLIAVKLARLDENETPTGLVFSVKYHDLENIPDFLILHHLYAESTATIYEPGDQIECILDGHWWSGAIHKKETFDEINFPRSHWYSLKVRWDTGEDETMSPWDVQPIGDQRHTGLATEEEYFDYSYIPRSDVDWNCCGGTAEECEKKLLDAISCLREEEAVAPFRHPVDLNCYPAYLMNVDYPIDLDTIAERAAKKYYRRFASMEQDIKYIALNASIFNEPRSTIVRNSRALVETLIRSLKSTVPVDVLELFNSLKDAPDSELREYKRQCRIKISSVNDNDSQSTMNTHDRHLDSTVTNFSAQEWMAGCLRIVETMSQSDFGRLLIDGGSEALNAAVSDGCRSLSSILSCIEQRVYTTPQEVADDVQKLLQSYRALVDDKRSALHLDSLNFSSRFNNLMAPILAKWQRFQQLSTEVNSCENGAAVGRHLRSRRKKNSHIYNTRQKEVSSKFDGRPGPSSSRSRRSARMPSGFYRNLNNGTRNSEAESAKGGCRKTRQKSGRGEFLVAVENNMHCVTVPDKSNDSGSSSATNGRSFKAESPDRYTCNDSPGPSCSRNGLNNQFAQNRKSKSFRTRKANISESEESSDEEQVKSDEEFVPEENLDENSSVDGENDASNSTYSFEDSISTKKNRKSLHQRTRKGGRLYNGSKAEAKSSKRKRVKRHTKVNSSSAESQTNYCIERKRRKKRSSVELVSGVNRPVYVTERTPESGEISDENKDRRSIRSRLRDKHINYNEDDGDDYVTSVSSRGRLRKQRSFR